MEKATRFTLAFLFAFLFVTGLGSAFIVSPTSISFSNPDSFKIIEFTGETGFNYTLSFPPSISLEGADGYIATFSLSGNNTINETEKISLNLSASSLDYSNFDLGEEYRTTVIIPTNKTNVTDSSVSDNINLTFSLEVSNSYCKYGHVGTLVEIGDIDDSDDFEWSPLEDIKITVEDVYNGADKKKDITVQLALYNSEGKAVYLTTEEKELELEKKILGGKKADFVFEFTLPADLDWDEDYTLYVKAYDKESDQCISASEPIDIELEEEVLIDELELPSVFFCGETSTISFKLYNLDMGDEEIMRANLYSQELGLNVYSDEFELDNGDSEYIELNFQVPTKEAKSYRFTLYVEYDYRESSDTFRDSESLGTYSIRIEGDQCKINEEFLPKINVSLDSETETKVGEDLVVKITLTNPGDSVNFVTVLENYNSWADSASLDESTFYLAKGESKVVTATFKPTESGVQEFNVRAVFNGKSIEQKVTVDIEESTGLFRTLFGEIKFNLTFWLTIAIFIVLILIILVLLVRFISSNKE